jgi:uncharacterized protein YjbI with pentapeptide repeats
MANDTHVSIFRQGVQAWNQWRSEHPELIPNLSGEDFSRLTNTQLKLADLSDTNLSDANLDYAYMKGTILRRAHLNGACCHNATLIEADLTGASLTGARLSRANFYRATCVGTDFSGSYLGGASFVDTQVEGASFDNCEVYGLSAWGLRGTPKSQLNLKVTPPGEPIVTADQLEVAQLIYTLLSNPKVRDVINTVGKKGVLILGRFSDSERKSVLNAIRAELRRRDYVPMVFDFERPTDRDFTETILTLTGLCRFIIADITNPRSTPLELQATVPNYMTPFVPIIREGEEPFAMFKNLHTKYQKWVLPPLTYDSLDKLLEVFDRAVIKPALEVHERLAADKAANLPGRHVNDYR